MSTQSGKLDCRIDIMRKVAESDPVYGTDKAPSWVLFKQVWAEVEDTLPSRAERTADAIRLATRPARVRIRYLSGLTADMRVIYRGETYQIIGGPARMGRLEKMEFVMETISTIGEAL